MIPATFGARRILASGSYLVAGPGPLIVPTEIGRIQFAFGAGAGGIGGTVSDLVINVSDSSPPYKSGSVGDNDSGRVVEVWRYVEPIPNNPQARRFTFTALANWDAD